MWGVNMTTDFTPHISWLWCGEYISLLSILPISAGYDAGSTFDYRFHSPYQLAMMWGVHLITDFTPHISWLWCGVILSHWCYYNPAITQTVIRKSPYNALLLSSISLFVGFGLLWLLFVWHPNSVFLYFPYLAHFLCCCHSHFCLFCPFPIYHLFRRNISDFWLSFGSLWLLFGWP